MAKKLFWVFLSIILIRVFIINFYMVDSGSMEETLYSGDVIVVNKFQYGVRLPLKPKDIPFVEAISYFLNAYKWSQTPCWGYRRLPEIAEVKRNDIILFDRDASKKVLVKRCVGLPGDTIQVVHNNRYANNILQKEPSTVKYSYCIKTGFQSFMIDSLSKYGLTEKSMLWYERDAIHMSMTRNTAAELQKSRLVDTVTIDDYAKGSNGPMLFTGASGLLETGENYGPLVIPAKGKTIQLRKGNIELYRDVIANCERNVLVVKEGSILINNKKATSYTFKGNYYFVIGDNRYHSVDSRYWGFVSESSIIGKVSCILFSVDETKSGLRKLRLSRIFKFINNE